MKKIKYLFIAVVSISYQFLMAQEESPFSDSVKTETSTEKKVVTNDPFSRDFFQPGWDARRYTSAIGFTTNYLAGNGLVYETKISSNKALAYFIGFTKSSDSYSSNITSTTSGIGTLNYNTTTTFSGTKSLPNYSLGAAYYASSSQTKFMTVRLGIYGGVDYYAPVNYNTGIKNVSYSSGSPETLTVTESGLGSVNVKRPLVFIVGPTVDAFTFLRWFPQLAIGFQGGILYRSNFKTRTKISTKSRVYQIINGVEQSPTSFSESNSDIEADAGSTFNTFSVAGQNFGFSATFTLRYIF